MRNLQKGFSKLLLLLLVATFLTAGGYFVWSKKFAYNGNPTCEQSKYKLEIMLDENTSEPVFRCYREINLKENKCVAEYFSLETGKKVSSVEVACFVY